MPLTPDTPFQRALVIGCSGAGKSTFARQLGVATGLPVTHIDQLFWEPGWGQTPDDIHRARLAAVVAQDRWIIDGTNSSTFDMRMARTDAVFWIDRPRIVCIARVLRRVASSYGRVRPDMAPGCPERFDWEFLKYVWNFQVVYDPRIHAALERYGLQQRSVRLTSDVASAQFLRRLTPTAATAGHLP